VPILMTWYPWSISGHDAQPTPVAPAFFISISPDVDPRERGSSTPGRGATPGVAGQAGAALQLLEDAQQKMGRSETETTDGTTGPVADAEPRTGTRRAVSPARSPPQAEINFDQTGGTWD